MDADLKAIVAAMSPENRAVWDRWNAAHDGFKRAHDDDSAVRSAWASLFTALDARSAARVALEEAQERCRTAAETLKLRTLPLASEALRQARAEAEGAAHDALKRAKAEMIEAQAEIDRAAAAAQAEGSK